MVLRAADKWENRKATWNGPCQSALSARDKKVGAHENA